MGTRPPGRRNSVLNDHCDNVVSLSNARMTTLLIMAFVGISTMLFRQNVRMMDAVWNEQQRAMSEERELRIDIASTVGVVTDMLIPIEYAHVRLDAARLQLLDLLHALRVVTATAGCRAHLPAPLYPFAPEEMVCPGWVEHWSTPVRPDGSCGEPW